MFLLVLAGERGGEERVWHVETGTINFPCYNQLLVQPEIHVYYTLKIFENFMFLEDENVPLVLGGLKVKSGQIGSTMEWYHWIGLEKDIHCYRFLIF